jgi:long-chain acyl-CoA synthetase
MREGREARATEVGVKEAKFDTLVEGVRVSLRIDGDGPILRWKTGKGGFDGALRRSEFLCLLDAFAGWCERELGGRPVVGILLPNRPEWHLAEFGAMTGRGTAVGFYLEEQLAYHQHKLDTSQVNVLVCADGFCREHGEELLASSPTLERILYCSDTPLDPRPATDLATERIRPFCEAIAPPGTLEGLEARAAALEPDAIIRHIYTSGTSGMPKAVPLTHKNLVVNARGYAQRLRLGRGYRYPSYLPLSHVYETGCSLNALLRGGTVFYSDKVHLREDLPHIRPTAFAGVPRVFHMVQKALAQSLPGAMRWLLTRPWVPVAVKKPLRSAILKKMGLAQCELWLSSGARLPEETFAFYKAVLGVELLSVYGLSETAGGVFVPAPGEASAGSVGRPLDGTQCQLAEDGEILVKGDAVFSGYLNHPANFDDEGWFHTGDLGAMRDSECYFEGRKSSIVKTAAGKFVNQESVAELLLSELELVQQVAVFAEGREFPVALVTVGDDPRVLQRLANTYHLELHSPDAFIRSPALIQRVEQELVRLAAALKGRDVAPAFKVRDFLYCPPFTPADNLLTPSLKLKHSEIAKRYRQELERFSGASRGEEIVFSVSSAL